MHFGKRSQEAPDPEEVGEDLARNWAFSPLITGPATLPPDKGDVDTKEPSKKPITGEDEPFKLYNCSEKPREETAISVSREASLASSSGLGLIVSSYSYSSSEDEL